MKIYIDGNKCKITRITGPAHNYLCLDVGKNIVQTNFQIVDVGIDKSNNVSESEIKEQVKQGLLLANQILSTNYIISQVEYCSSDTPSSSIYIDLTREIIFAFDNRNQTD